MLRSNYAVDGEIKEFCNNNINVKLTADGREKILSGHYSALEIISYLLDSIDTYIIGDEFCLSNFDCGCMLYNLYSDKCYILSFGALESIFKGGKTLKLHAYTPDKYERESINEFLGE